jgi:hypothetical protein
MKWLTRQAVTLHANSPSGVLNPEGANQTDRAQLLDLHAEVEHHVGARCLVKSISSSRGQLVRDVLEVNDGAGRLIGDDVVRDVNGLQRRRLWSGGVGNARGRGLLKQCQQALSNLRLQVRFHGSPKAR